MPTYSIKAPNGRVYEIEGPNGASQQDVINEVLRQYPDAAGTPQAAAPTPPAQKSASLADFGYSALGGIGSLVAFPGQLYGLATGDVDNRLTQAGESITKYAKEQQSEGLKARQAAQQAAIAAADKEGVLSGFGTAITSTLKDPVLLGNFIAENIPNMIPGFGIARGTMSAGMRIAAKEIAAQGLEGEARAAALKAAQDALVKKATAASVGTAAVQQGADVGAQAYEDIYKKLKEKGASNEDAASQALSLARSAGASAAVISYLSTRLPGARALEEAFVGAKGAKAATTGAIKGFLGEAASEAVEEGGGKFAQNVAMSTVDPTQNLMQGVGSTAGMGALLGGTLGGVAGMRNSMREADIATQQDILDRQKAALDKARADQQAAVQRLARLQDPKYLDDLLERSNKVNATLQELQTAAKGSADATDPVAQAEKQNARRALAAYKKSDEYKAFVAEIGLAAPFLRKRQTEIAAQQKAAEEQQKAAEAQKVSEAAAASERERVANLTPEQYALEQLQQDPTQWTGTPTGGRRKGALGVVTKADIAEARAAKEQAEQAPILAQQKPLQEYVAQQLEHPRSLGITDTGTFVSYLMQDPAKARSIVETRTPMPDLSPQQNREVLAALQSALDLKDKQQRKTDAAATTAEYARRTEELKQQLPQKPTAEETNRARAAESMQQMLEDEAGIRETGEANFDYLLPTLEKAASGSAPPAVKPAAPVPYTNTADKELAAIDALQAKIDQANKDEQAAKRANEASVAEAARSRRIAASDELNKLTGGGAYTSEVVRQRYIQQTALDEMQNHAERIRQGQYLGYNFNADPTKTAGMVADLKAQIAAREADKARATDRGEIQRIDAELTQLKVQLNAAETAATRVTDRRQSDLASTTLPLLWKKAEAARDSYIRSILQEAAAHRAARGLKGLTHDEALKVASELHDLLDLRIDRRDGERNKFINQRLAEIKQGVNNPTRERTRIPAEPLNVQYAATEAKKTAEERGETAKTLGGELRRRAEYVGNLIEKALGRDMPADVRSALEDAQRAIEDRRVTRDLLNAAETQAERVLMGRLKGLKTTYSQDPTKRGRGVAEANLEEDPRYVQDIRDALAATEEVPAEQGELFAPVDNTASIDQREKEIAGIDKDIAEQQALKDRLEKAISENRTDPAAAAERIAGIDKDIEAKRQQQDDVRAEIARLKQEETDKKAVSKQIEDLGTPVQKGEPQVHETLGGFTPDDQAAFGKTPPMATSVRVVSLLAKSPALRKAKRDAAKLREATASAEARTRLYRQIVEVRTKIVEDLQAELDEVMNLLASHEWITKAFPQIYAKSEVNKHNIAVFQNTMSEQSLRNETMARLGIDKIRERAAKIRESIAAERKTINQKLVDLAEGNPAAVAAKKRAQRVGETQQAVSQQRKVLQEAMDAARDAALARIRVEREEIYGSPIAQLEGQISGLTVQLEKARTALDERLAAEGPLGRITAISKAGSYATYVNNLFAEQTKDVRAALDAAQKQLDALYEQLRIPSTEINVKAMGDKLVKFEFARLEKLQKTLDKLLAKKAPSAEVAAATDELSRQRGEAEQARRMAADASDAVYRARNERLTQESTLTRDARLAPLERQLSALEAEAKQITSKRGFAKLTALEKATQLSDVNQKIAAVQTQIRTLKGETPTSAYGQGAQNASVEARIARLEDMIASPRSSAQRVLRARTALDLLQKRTRQMGRVVGPVARDASPVTARFNVGDTAAETEAKTSAAPTTGQRKKYLDQKRAPVKSNKSDALVAAELRFATATKNLQTAREAAEAEGLSRAKQKAADAAFEAAVKAHDAAQLALETEQARNTKSKPEKPAAPAQDRRKVRGDWDEDFELQFSSGRVQDAHTVDSLVQELQEQTGKDVRGRVNVYATVADLLSAHPEYSGRIPSDAKGFVDGTHAFLVAGNVGVGSGLSVLLHEIGVHIGMRQLFHPELYKSLVAAIDKWANKNDGSLESRIMQAAQQRVAEADTPAHQRSDELLAYAVEEALNAGVTPTALGGKGVVGQWMARVLQAVQKVLMRFGINVKGLSAQQLVDMAYGAAGKELSSTTKRHGGSKLLSYAGKQSATADHPSLAKATQMVIDGKGPSEVYKETGWFVGADGKWRYEIDDREAKLMLPDAAKQLQATDGFDEDKAQPNEMYEARLRDVLDHPSLYAAYPLLGDKRIVFYNSKDADLGYTDKKTVGVNVNRGEADAMNTLLHELQHVIQGTEGFTSGASAKAMYMRLWDPVLNDKLLRYYERTGDAAFADVVRRHKAAVEPLADVYKDAQEQYEQFEKQLAEDLKKNDALEAERDAKLAEITKQLEAARAAKDYRIASKLHDEWMATSASYRAQLFALKIIDKLEESAVLSREKHDAYKAVTRASDKFFEAEKKSTTSGLSDTTRRFIPLFLADKAYQNKYGEVEARDTSARRNLTAEARRTTRPYSSEDVYLEELVFSRGRSAFEQRTQETRGTARQLLDAKGSLGLAMRQATADMRASLRELLQRGDFTTGMQAQASLLTADNYIGNGMAAAEQGAFQLTKDAKGYIKMAAGGSKSLADVLQMTSKIPLRKAEDRIAKFQAYVTALRGEQVGYDMLDPKDPKGAEADGRALLAEVRANPEMLSALQAAHEVYRDLNRGLIQFLKDTHSIPEDVADKLIADKNYIPFYRESGDAIEMVMPDGHPQAIGDIRSLPFLKTLKGGDDKLMAFPEAALRNISLLTNLGVQNMANRQIAYHLSGIGKTAAKPTMQVHRRDGGANRRVLRWRQEPDPAIPNDDGKRHIVLDTEGTAAEDIPTDLLVKAVAGSYATFPWLVDVAGSASNLLRAGVTRNPAYLIGQLIKDPFNASMTGNLKASPLRAIAQVIGNFGRIITDNSPEQAALRSAGVVHSNVFSGSKNDLNKVALQIAGDQQGFIKRGLAGLDKLAMSADAATRTQAYKDAIASGASEVEAIVSARELANFGRHGSEPSVQFLARAIPFFNASIQGLDATLRSAQGKMPAAQLYAAKQRFFNRALGLAAMTFAYAMAMEDDEKWRRMSLRDKISYIHIPRIFGMHDPLRLPAPFETGMLFYSMPMAMTQALKGTFTPEDWKVVRDVFLSQMPGSGSIMPQLFKGAYDVSRNYNSGTGQPIVPKNLEGKDPLYQYTARTTEAAKRMAEGLNAAGVKLSAMQIEYLANAYLGSLPVAVAQMTNQAFAKAAKADVERPTGHESDWPIIGRFFQSGRGMDDINHVYEFANKAKMANDTFNMLKSQGNAEEAREYLISHRPEIAMAPFAAQFTKVMGNIKKMEDFTRNAPNVSGEEKQKRLDKLQEQKETFAANFRKLLARAPAPA